MDTQKKQVDPTETFDEAAFRREWAIRGVGMGMIADALHGARCYHHWFVKGKMKLKRKKK